MLTGTEDTDAKLRKKIVIGITKATWGGAQRYSFDLATHLPRDQFEVVLVAGTPGTLAEKLEAGRIRTVFIPGLGRDMRWLGELRILARLVQILQKEKPDILHLNSPKMAGLGSVAGRLVGTQRIIITIHGWSFAEKRNLLARAVIWFFSWLTAMLAHRIIVITAADLRAAGAFPFIPQSKFLLIPNGIEQNLPYLDRDRARQELERLRDAAAGRFEIPPNGPFIIGAISELTPNKDLPTLIRACLKLPSKTLCIIIGSGEDEAELKKLIDKLGLTKRVLLAGFIPEAWRLLASFDCFVISSAKEGLPYALMEAMAAGLAAVGTKVGGIPDLMREGETGFLVPPGNPDRLAEGILKIFRQSPEVRQMFGGRARTLIRSRFNLDRMLEETSHLYICR